MKQWILRLTSCLATVASMVVLLIALPLAVQAGEPVDCSRDMNDMGKKIPVLQVHGLFGRSSIWDSMTKTLNKVQDGYVTLPFDYSSDFNNINWVTDINVGPKLAATIACLADASKKNGGPGKVAVIGHSMGGLAAQYAAAQVPEKVAHVTTIGTPHKGSILGNTATALITSLCTFPSPLKGVYQQYITKENCSKGLAFTGLSIGSKELDELPPFPSQVPVKAIAGNITPQMRLGALTINGKVLDSDAVVHVPSALGKFTMIGKGDGKKEVGCTGFLVFANMSDASCEHSRLVNDPTVQQEVKKGLEEYLASTRKPAAPTANFFGLQLPLDTSRWEVLGPADDPFSSDRKIVVSKTDCGPQDFKMYCSGFVVVNMNAAEPKLPYKVGKPCNYNQIHDNLGWSKDEGIGKITVDGAEGEHFIQRNDCRFDEGIIVPKQGGDTLHGWRFPGKGVLMYDSEGTKKFSTQPFSGVEELLKTATWK